MDTIDEKHEASEVFDDYSSPKRKKRSKKKQSSSKTKGIVPAEEDLDMSEMANSKQKY